VIDFLVSPKVFAVSCELKNLQLTAEKLYLKEPFLHPEKVNLYDGDSLLIASVTIPKTNTQVHTNITLDLCP
jgi:hypothetical protein